VSYTHITTAARPIALACARGDYQRALLVGGEAWSGMTLQGRAAEFRSRYRDSASSLLDRLKACPELEVKEVIGHHNRKEVDVRLVGELNADLIGEDAEALAGIAP